MSRAARIARSASLARNQAACGMPYALRPNTITAGPLSGFLMLVASALAAGFVPFGVATWLCFIAFSPPGTTKGAEAPSGDPLVLRVDRCRSGAIACLGRVVAINVAPHERCRV